MQQEPRVGAPGVQRGSEQSGDTPTTPKSQRSLADEIRAFRPWEADTTIQLRCRLNRAAVGAAARATSAQSPHARQAFWFANAIAVEWLWARAKDEQLADMLGAVDRMLTCADTLERNGSGA